MSRGRVVLEAWEQRLLDQRESVVVTARCSFCDEFEMEGTVADTRAAYTEHRQESHPDVKVKQRHKRHRPYRVMQSETSLDDNIANARAQGAASWAGPL